MYFIGTRLGMNKIMIIMITVTMWRTSVATKSSCMSTPHAGTRGAIFIFTGRIMSIVVEAGRIRGHRKIANRSRARYSFIDRYIEIVYNPAVFFTDYLKHSARLICSSHEIIGFGIFV
jgi:hypothetical protein